ncbi:MAG: 4-hydroxyphenylpyruvate dioxygenase [bacterium]
MGPFPHHAKTTQIDENNPAGTDGMEFVEFVHPQPEELDRLFRQMGYAPVAKHKTKDVTLYRQGDINYIVNNEPGSHADQFKADHGPSVPSMAWRVIDADHALQHALALGAEEYTGLGKTMDVPAIIGIGGSLIYLIDNYKDGNSPYSDEFNWLNEENERPEGLGFYYLDHLTHNLNRGNMDVWYGFYERLFNFRELRYFDIKGKQTGLISRALTSACGKIRIPLNESSDDKSQIEEYLQEYKGEGIQHIAVGSENIYDSVDGIAERGIEFMPAPPDIYYDMSTDRVTGHTEPLDALRKHGILIDGDGVSEDGKTRILLQIFSKTVIGPVFFEFIQRKGDDGFGEGNFTALFESIEADQMERGVL